jgi:hypothetical protein
MMKVKHLIEMLEECPQDAVVRSASQPSWPFENTIVDVVSYDKDTKVEMEVECIRQAIEDDGAEKMSYPEMKALAESNLEFDGELDEEVVYLQEGSQIGYLPDGPKEAMGW